MNDIVPDDTSLEKARRFTEGTQHPRKKVVVVGLWMLHGTVIGVCGFVWFVSLVLDRQPMAAKFPLILAYLIPTIFLAALSVIILYKSTKRYFSEKKSIKNDEQENENP